MKICNKCNEGQKEIQIKDEHTFNNWGSFTIVCDGISYFAKWTIQGNKMKLETDAPDCIYKRVYNYLFDKEI